MVVEFLQCQRVRRGIENHVDLGLVEEGPHLIDRFQMLSRNFVELAFRGIQLFLVLGYHNFVIEIEEPSDLWYLLYLQGGQTQEKLVKSLQQPGVKLRPVRGEVIMHKYSCHKG